MGGTLQPINLKKDYKNRDILDYVRWNADQQAIENVANKLINSTEDGDSGADNISMTAIQSISTATSLQSFLEALATMLISAQAAAKLGAVAPDADISGNNIQAILNSLKTYIDSALNILADNINLRVKSTDLAKTDGTGGSSIIGSKSIIGVAGDNVYQQMVSLKQAIDQIVAGQIPDGYIDNTKLADDIKIGSLAALATAVKTSVVNALNEIVDNIGDLSTLSTTDKTKVVNALNEILGNVGDKANLTTKNKTSLVGAVNEIKSTLDAHKSENAKKEVLLYSGYLTGGSTNLSYEGSLDDFDEIVVQVQPDVYVNHNCVLYPRQNLLTLDYSTAIVGSTTNLTTILWIEATVDKTNKTITIVHNRMIKLDGSGYEGTSTRNKITYIYGLKRGI